MHNISEIVGLIGLSQKLNPVTIETIAEFKNIELQNAEEIFTDIKFIRNIFDLIETMSFDEIVSELNIDKSILVEYMLAMSIAYPGKIQLAYIQASSLLVSLNKIKKAASIQWSLESGISENDIIKKMSITDKQLENIRSNIKDHIFQDDVIDTLERKNDVRRFFTENPHSTVYEASQKLVLPPNHIRKTIESMLSSGEHILYRNMPSVLEMEMIKSKIMDIKLEQPELGNAQIAQLMGVSSGMVQNVVRDAAKQWRLEKVDSYEFFFRKVYRDLSKCQEEVMRRHHASDRSSSKWMEMNIDITKKIIDLFGLNAPERKEIAQQVSYQMTSEERDRIVDASLQTEFLDIDFKKIEITGGS